MDEQSLKSAMPKKYKAFANDKELVFDKAIVSREEFLTAGGFLPVSCYSLYIVKEHNDFDPILAGDMIDLSYEGKERLIVKEATVFSYTLNKELETTDSRTLTPVEILKLGGKNPDKEYLIQVIPKAPDIVYAYTPETEIKMVCSGLEFITKPWLEQVNIEEYGMKCLPVPPTHSFIVPIHGGSYTFTTPFVTGKELILKTGRSEYQEFEIYKAYSNSTKKQVEYNEEVDLTEQCLVRFLILPKKQEDGRGNDQPFILPEEDVTFLDNQALPWECLINNGEKCILINDFPVPEGYNAPTVTVALKISPLYPATEIDMAYFYPQLVRKDGRQIHAISAEIIKGLQFQRWSRHRKPNEWLPGVDNIATHLILVENWLRNELKR
ncbi:E2/UBC family protein [Chitinophaga sp. LS1]|uniref:E2/UBC family protein n=1 Tax=Chitinophaga sp. LS1 TaxID=3051176 RepID=UPI002AABA09E|nr:E2/UBC family protein [Chitinophaga sp. LS1]WPV67510.1 E2/UBC family protein [Chitinophaga sp. LS1]